MIGSWDLAASRRAVGLGVALAFVALALLSLAGVAHGKEEYEHNDTRESAYGPLAGGNWYTAEFETVNDVDWYYFYVKTYSQVDFSATLVNDECSATFLLRDGDGETVRTYPDSLSAYSEKIVDHLLLTMNPGRYYLEVDGCQGDRYKFKIDPASAITSSRECGEAIIARNDAAPELDKVTGLIANNSNSLAKAEGVIAKQAARLAGLTQQWRKLKRRWTRNGRRIRNSRRTRYRKRIAWRRLRSAKRQANQRLAAAKQQPKAKLEKAEGTREEILVKRVGLQTLGAQHTAAVTGADKAIAEHC